MCFHTKQTKKAVELENRFKATFHEVNKLIISNALNGFTHPQTPVIANSNDALIDFYKWGLIPNWAKDETISEYTLNAKIETLNEKPSFKGSVSKRCLVLVDGFYEWQWLTADGKKKQKYKICLPNDEAFAMAGLWSEWVNKETGEIIKSYTIVTTEANDLMSKIHNNKKRMPIILNSANETDWLKGSDIMNFKKCDIELLAEKV